MSATVVQWICKELTKLLGFDATEDIARYILAIETVTDLKEYLNDLLDPSISSHQRFIDQLIRKWRPPERVVVNAVPDNVKVYRKKDDDDNSIVTGDKTSKSSKKKGKKSTDITENISELTSHLHLNDTAISDIIPDKKSPRNQLHGGAIKKTKFVPLFSDEGHAKTVAKLPGRYACECLATKHNLISNCIKCGRIVCEQEGSGPCIFCGNLVCTKEEQEVLARGSKKSEKLRLQLMSKDQGGHVSNNSSSALPNMSLQMSSGLQKAMAHKDKLLEYDRTSVKRTQVIDDESDYFSTDSKWLSKKEKAMLSKREEELRALRFASRKDRKVTLDFAGRQVVEAGDTVDMYNVKDSVIQAVHYDKNIEEDTSQGAQFTSEDFTDLVNPAIKQNAPQFVESGSSNIWVKMPGDNADSNKKPSRIQDKEILEMSDEGMCMSMHQPWASLLVKGIKIHEGRTWYTTHRGRLWIAATSKTPTAEDIHALEHQYTQHYNDTNIPFPKDYPAGCLLGCVDIVDCLPREEYIQKFPDGESGSQYVFICENPQELVVKFPIKGKHKIYKLDHHIHQGAKKGLRRT